MRIKTFWLITSLLLISTMLLAACTQATPTTEVAEPPAAEEPAATEEAAAPAAEELMFGMLMVGPYNDHGWSQAHYEAGLYVEEKLPGAENDLY